MLLPAAAMLLATAIGVLLPSIRLPDNPPLFLPMIFISMVLGPQVVRWIRGRADTFSLTAWACALLLLGHTLIPLIQLQTDRWFVPHIWGDIKENLYHALWVALIGLIAFVMGMKMPFVGDFAQRIPVATYLSPRRIMLAAFVYMGLGLAMNLYLFHRHGGLDVYLFDPRSTGLGLDEGYLSIGLELTGVGVFLFAFLWMQSRSWSIATNNRNSHTPGVWLFFLMSILVFLGSTFLLRLSRSFIISEIIGLVVMYHYLVHPLRLRRLAILMLTAMVFASFLGVVRNPGIYSKLEAFTPGAMWDNRDWLVEEIYDYAPTVILSDPGRLEMLTVTLERLQEPSKQLLWGKTYVAAFVQVVPRTVWPNKWLTSAGEFNDLINGKGFFQAHGQFFGTWATGMMVEGYLNFHLPGLILASFLIGIGLAVFERYRIINSKVPSSMLIYAVIFPFLFRLPLADFGTFLFYLGRIMVPLLLALRFASRYVTVKKKAKKGQTNLSPSQQT